MLEVPWHRERPWRGEGPKPVRSWLEVSKDQDANSPNTTVPAGDPTGQAQELDEVTSVSPDGNAVVKAGPFQGTPDSACLQAVNDALGW